MPLHSSTVGLVINKRTSKEDDLTITLLTPTMGKIIVRALGAKKIKSSRLSTLQLGNTIKAQLYTKYNQTWLSESQTLTSFLHHQKSLTQHNLLFYFLELINQLIVENQHTPGIYEISAAIVQAIDQNNFKEYIKNEIELLKVLGFGVPETITSHFMANDFQSCQKFIKSFLESLIEKKLESNKLFR